MHLNTLLDNLFTNLSLNSETWISILIGITASFGIAYLIYRIQKKETIIHKQDHDAKLEEIKLLHQQDSEKIKVLYELIIQSQRGSLGEIESAVLEQKIELAADQITEQDSDQAQALKAIAEKDKEEADNLLDKIAQQEHNLVEMYKLRALNEFRNGFYSEAVKWYRKILDLEPDNLDIESSLIKNLNLADQKPEARQLALRRLGEFETTGSQNYRKLIDYYGNLVDSYDVEVYNEDREQYLEKWLDLVRQHYDKNSYEMFTVLNTMADCYSSHRSVGEVEEIFLKCLSIVDSGKIEPDKDLFSVYNNLGNFYLRQQRYEEALPMAEKSLQEVSRIFGPEHLNLLYPLSSLSEIAKQKGDFKKAEELMQKAINLAAAKLGKEHELYGVLTSNLAIFYFQQERYSEVETILKENMETAIRTKGEDSFAAGKRFALIAEFYKEQKMYDKAELYFDKALSIYQMHLDEKNDKMFTVRHCMYWLKFDTGEHEEAIKNVQHFLEVYAEMGPDYSERLAIVKSHLGRMYEKTGQCIEAESYLKQALDYFLANSPETQNCLIIMEHYVETLSKLGRQEEAATWEAKAEELKARLEAEKVQPTTGQKEQ